MGTVVVGTVAAGSATGYTAVAGTVATCKAAVAPGIYAVTGATAIYVFSLILVTRAISIGFVCTQTYWILL